MRTVVVYNPHSGTSLPTDKLRDRFDQAGIEVIATIKIADDLSKKLAPYMERRDIIIAAYGGDGTHSSVASLLMETDVTFAPLPGGTLNHFTKDLGIPQDLDEALAGLRKAKSRHVDVACVNDRAILNNSSIGLYPSALQMRDEMSRKSIGKWPAAVIASFKAFWRYHSYTVTIDGDTFRTPFVFVGNNDYQLENNLIGQRTKLHQGTLSVYAVASTGRLHLLVIFLRALLGRLESTDEIKIWKTDQLVIHADRKVIRISRDGEHEKITPPLKYKICPRALRIIGSS